MAQISGARASFITTVTSPCDKRCNYTGEITGTKNETTLKHSSLKPSTTKIFIK